MVAEFQFALTRPCWYGLGNFSHIFVCRLGSGMLDCRESARPEHMLHSKYAGTDATL